MRTRSTYEIAHSGNMGEGRLLAKIDEGAASSLMAMLTDMYSDPVGSIVREYPINAMDSHARAGTTRPIEVVRPSIMHPIFEVRDYGTGLTMDEALHHFRSYGATTKRDTDEETGYFGVGSKCAMTLVSQFTVEAYKDGVKSIILVSRDKDGRVGVEPVEQMATTEPNGVHIKISVPRPESFRYKIDHFFQFWPEGSVLVDGEPPKAIDGIWIDENVVLVEHSWDIGGLDRDYVVMGNIPYPVEYEHEMSKGIDRTKAVVFVPMGEVTFTTNREQLVYDAPTKETLTLARNWIRESLARSLQEELDNATFPHEAIKIIANKWYDILLSRSLDVTYMGRGIPSHLEGLPPRPWRTNEYDGPRFFGINLDANEARQYWNNDLPIKYLADAPIIVQYSPKSVPTVNRKRMEKFLKKNGIDSEYIYVSGYLQAPVWFDPKKVFTWEQVREETTPPKKVRQVKKKKYRALTKDPRGFHRFEEWDAFPAGKQVVYFSPSEDREYRRLGPISLAEILQQIMPNAIIACVNKSGFSRLKKDYPKAVHAKKAVENRLARWSSRLTDSQKFAVNALLSGRSYDLVRSLDMSKVVDPELQMLSYSTLIPKEKMRQWALLNKARIRLRGPRIVLQSSHSYQDLVRSIHEKYPLLNELMDSEKEHVTDYVNALYLMQQRTARQEELK